MAPVMHLCGDTKLVTDLLQLSIPSLQKTSIIVQMQQELGIEKTR